jgi:hypothetical protein
MQYSPKASDSEEGDAVVLVVVVMNVCPRVSSYLSSDCFPFDVVLQASGDGEDVEGGQENHQEGGGGGGGGAPSESSPKVCFCVSCCFVRLLVVLLFSFLFRLTRRTCQSTFLSPLLSGFYVLWAEE